MQISSAITLMCPYTLQVTHIDVKQFYNNPFSCIAGSRQLTRYIILDIEPLESESGRYKLAEAQARSVVSCTHFMYSLLSCWHAVGCTTPGVPLRDFDASVVIQWSCLCVWGIGWKSPRHCIGCYNQQGRMNRAQE